MKIEMLIGMIASGKSTYARKRADEGALVISHDDLTQMLHGGVYRYEQGLRNCYRAMMVQLVHNAIVANRDAVIDRTHLTKESRALWMHTAIVAGVDIVAVSFPIAAPEIHARRRFESDDRGRPYAEWLKVATDHAEQARLEPLNWQFEGFTSLIQARGIPS